MPEQAGWAIYIQYILHIYTYCIYAVILLLVKKKRLCSQLLMEDTQELLFVLFFIIIVIFMRRAVGLAVASPLSACGLGARWSESRKPQRTVSSICWRSKAAAAPVLGFTAFRACCMLLAELPQCGKQATCGDHPPRQCREGPLQCQRSSERAACLLALSVAGPCRESRGSGRTPQ